MGSEMETTEQRLKSFTRQLHTECGILERLVYKHKNQHRGCSYFQYILKVRRNLKLLKLADLEEILEASFLVINGNGPKQKMVEPMLKAAIEISTLLARSFFMKFSLTTLAVLARVRVIVQQLLLDAVHLYNTISSLSQREQTVKSNKERFEVLKEYYPRKEEATMVLECIWQTDKYVLIERTHRSENKRQEMDGPEDVLLNA